MKLQMKLVESVSTSSPLAAIKVKVIEASGGHEMRLIVYARARFYVSV